MALNLSLPQDPFDIRPRITVIGVGGAGGNAVNNMIRSQHDPNAGFIGRLGSWLKENF